MIVPALFSALFFGIAVIMTGVTLGKVDGVALSEMGKATRRNIILYLIGIVCAVVIGFVFLFIAQRACFNAIVL